MKTSKRFGWPREIQALLALLGILLMWSQYTAMTSFWVLPSARSYESAAKFVAEVRQHVGLNASDGLLFGSIAALCFAVVVVEILNGNLSLFLKRVFASERHTVVLLCLSAVVFVRFYFGSGELSWAGDASHHVATANVTAGAVARGELPIWTNYFGAGSPYLQFYGFLFFYLVGLVAAIATDVSLALKFVMGMCHVASGVSMYLLVRILCRSRKAGFLGAVAYVLCFWHTQQVIIMGRLPLSLFYALLPLPFYCFERLRISSRPKFTAGVGGVSLGLLAFTHPGYALWAGVLLSVYAGLSIWTRRRQLGTGRVAAHSALLLAVGVAFGAFLTVPMWVERGYTTLSGGFSLSEVPDPTWRHVLVWSNYRFWLWPLPGATRHWYGGYLGISLVAVALFGLICPLGWRRGRQMRAAAPGVCLIVALTLVFGYRLPLLEALPPLRILSAGRYLMFVSFFLALMVGLGTHGLMLVARRRQAARGPGRQSMSLYSAVLIAVICDLGPATFQQPYEPPDGQVGPLGYARGSLDRYLRDAREFESRGELPDYRLFWAMGDVYHFAAVSQLQVGAATPSPHELRPGALQASSEFTDPLEMYLNIVLRNIPDPPEKLFTRPDFPLMAGGLAMLNVKHLLATQADGEVIQLELPSHSPVLVSSRVGAMPPQQELRFATERAREWVERGIFGPDRIEEGVEMFRALMIAEWSRCGTKANSCERFLLLDYSGEDDLGGDPAVRVLEHRVWNEKVRMRVQTSSRCFARLSYAFYPFLEVTVDGREVAPLQTADRFIVVPLEAGTHDIELAARLSPLRQALLGLDIALLIGLGLLAAFERGRVRRWWRQLPLPRPSTLLTGRQSG